MNVLFVSYMEPDAPCGVRTYYQLLRAGLEAQGHVTRLITPACAPRPVRWVTGAGRRLLGAGGNYSNSVALELKNWWRLYAAVRSLGWVPDLVHAQDVGSGSAAAAALKHRCPLLVTAHFNEDPVGEILDRNGVPDHPARWWRRRLARQFSGIRHYVAPSRAAADGLRRWVPAGSQIRVVPNACDFASLGATSPAADLRGLASTRQVILSAGTLEARKDPWFLLELASALASRDNVLMLHAGDGPLRGELEAAVATRQLANLRFLGHRPDLAAVMKSARLFVHFPRRETFGLVVIEAIAAGVPVLARRVGGIPDILDGLENACLYEAEAPASVVGRDILSLLDTPDRLARLTAEQYKGARLRFDQPAFIQAMVETYRPLLESPREPA
jgi:glycosyltransferase involved in cell wall biosynthesis